MVCLKKAKGGTEILLDYCSGALDPSRVAELERHIESCAECSRVVEAQREVWSRLDMWKAPGISADFNARLYARIAQENRMPLWRQWVRRLAYPALPYTVWKPAAAAMACAALAIGLSVQAPRHSMAPAPAAAQVESQQVDIEQVASALEELDLLMPASASSATSTATANPM